nr:hypothetical protein [Planctomycetota bacterium]
MSKRFSLLLFMGGILCALSVSGVLSVDAQEATSPVKANPSGKSAKVTAAPKSVPGPEKLLNGGNFWDHWEYFSEEKDANINLIWKVVSGGNKQPSTLI